MIQTSVAAAILACIACVTAGSIDDVKHIVIFMQENRPFDHYYGKMAGTRGFNDRAAPPLPNGQSVFYQPGPNSTYILPFYLAFNKTSASCMPAPTMTFEADTNMFNGGLQDAWNVARDPGFGMSHFDRNDLPYYYALTDAFTVGDQYFQSTFTATNPNRQHLFSGSNGLSIPGSKYNMLDDSEPLPGFEWETMAETLEKSNISWRVIQELDNFDDNAFAWFKNFREALPGSPLYEKGKKPVLDLVDAFAQLVANDELPQVTWIVGPADKSEHATNHPADGEELSSQLLAVLSDPNNAAVYAKTAFILNYDEGGQFFDHVVPPTPHRSPEDGKSTVTTVGELTLTTRWGIPPGHPIGLGFRVPLILISPWTRGHFVFSQVSDHTSVIKFIEQRFGVRCPNISPWRRAVTSNLTAAFDWNNPDFSWPKSFPSTSGNTNQSEWQCENLPMPTLPTEQHMPSQEPGTRRARPLPYVFDVQDSVSSDGETLTVTMTNKGDAGAVFYVYNLLNTTAQPKKYTVEAGKFLSDDWSLFKGMYNVSLYGPNGFVRSIAGTSRSAGHGSRLEFHESEDSVEVQLTGPKYGLCSFQIVDNAYTAGGPWKASPQAGSVSQVVSTKDSGSWYDVTMTPLASSKCGLTAVDLSRRFMGRMETGRETTSDPAMAVPDFNSHHNVVPHPAFPSEYAAAIHWKPTVECGSDRSRFKDACWAYGADREMRMWMEEHRDL